MKTYIKQIWSFFAILSIAFLPGCKEETKVGPLPEPVDLTMDIASNNLAMGESLDITFSVADEKSEIANEDFNIELSLQCSDLEKPSVLFKDFPTSVAFAKGEKSKTISVPVIDAGISSTTYNVTLSAFVRSYKVSNSSQLITVSDYHRVSMAVKNNSSKEIIEGEKFILTASLLVPAKEDVEVTIQPKSGEEDKYEGIESNALTVTIPQGEKSIDTNVITLKDDDTDTGDEDLTFELSTISTEHPLSAESFAIKKIEISTPPDPNKVMDERWLYRRPHEMFVSPGRKAAVEKWTVNSYTEMTEGAPHPNYGGILPTGRWKFYRAYEFHHIDGCMITKESAKNNFISHEYPACFADQNTVAVETAGNVDNVKYAWITNEGYLRMITLKESTVSARGGDTKDYGTSAFYANKFNHNNTDNHGYLAQNVRIYPGMRIETRARILGSKAGMLPGIWLQGNQAQGGDEEWVKWPTYGEIDVMENNTVERPNTIEQTYHFGPLQSDEKTHYNPTTSGGVPGFSGTVDKFNIYWVEWIDNHTVAMGVNGVETLRVTETEVVGKGYKWPFTTDVNTQGLHYLLTMMFLGKDAPTEGDAAYADYTAAQVRSSGYDWANSQVPRMEIDWVRFYIDDTYEGDKLSSNNTLFY